MYVSTLPTLLLSSRPSGGRHRCPRQPIYSGLLSSHNMELTSPRSPLPHGPLSTLVSADLAGQDCCFLVLSRGVTNCPGDQGSAWTGERRLFWVPPLHFLSSHFLPFLRFIAFLFLFSRSTISSFSDCVQCKSLAVM